MTDGAQRAVRSAPVESDTAADGSAVIDLRSDAVVDLTDAGQYEVADGRTAPLRLVETTPPKWWRLHHAAKATLDYGLASVTLLLLTPVFLIIALAIKLDDWGPVFFLQERVGRHGSRFRMVKFRTMFVDADEALHREHTARVAGGAAPLKIEDDPRITRVGSFLRRWSLDELPNLWNVMTGQMSTVGPRPLVPYEAEHLSQEQFRRFDMKPGITGLAQVSGRLEMPPDDRTSFDIEYVETHSFWMDLSLIVRTPISLLRSKG